MTPQSLQHSFYGYTMTARPTPQETATELHAKMMAEPIPPGGLQPKKMNVLLGRGKSHAANEGNVVRFIKDLLIIVDEWCCQPHDFLFLTSTVVSKYYRGNSARILYRKEHPGQGTIPVDQCT